MNRSAGRWWPGGVLLIILCLGVYLPGLRAIPPIDRDECRFAQASRQMLDSTATEGWRAWIVPVVQDTPRLNKPPLIYWLQASSAGLLSSPGSGPAEPRTDAIWMYRIPSVLSAMVAVLVTWRLGRRMFDARAAWLGAALLAVSPVVVFDAHQARADQLLLACTVIAQAALYHVWRNRHRPAGRRIRAAALWIAIGLGVLAKGPITPMVALLTALSLSILRREYRWLLSALAPVQGVAILAAMVLPWVALVAQRVGWEWYLREIYEETLGRSVAPKEGHWGPPGYHLVFMILLFWPGSLLAAAAIARAFRRAAPAGFLAALRTGARGRHAELFLLGWLIPAWIVFELVSTKLPHYTMPLYPALALLCARAVFAAAAGRLPMVRTRISAVGFAGWMLLGLGLCSVAPVVLLFLGEPIRQPRIFTTVIVGSIMLALIIFTAYLFVRRGRFAHAQITSVLAMPVLSFMLFQLIFPSKSEIWNTPRIVAAVHQLDPAHARPLAAVGYHEDSLVFSTRGRVRRIDAASLPEWLAQNPTGMVIAPRTLAADFPDLAPTPASTGFNYSNGKRVDLVILSRPTSTPSP